MPSSRGSSPLSDACHLNPNRWLGKTVALIVPHRKLKTPVGTSGRLPFFGEELIIMKGEVCLEQKWLLNLWMCFQGFGL